MSHSAELACVDPFEVHAVWPHVSLLILSAIRRGGLSSFAAIEHNVLAGKALLWLASADGAIHAAAVTELHRTEWRKICVIVACGGRQMRRWIGLIKKIEEFARAEKCSAVRILGREGWSRVLPDYDCRRVLLEKELV